MPVKLEWSKNQLWNGCILAGIAHAILVGKYPLMANEHSWDGLNYSVQDSSGQRGTVSFRDEYCVAVFRNDNSLRMNMPVDLKKYFDGADDSIIQLAYEEALHYLLDEIDGEVKPIITTAFWGRENLITNDTFVEMLMNGGKLIENQIREISEAVQYWKENYELNDKQVNLMKSLYKRKSANPDQRIYLTKKEVDFIGAESEDGRIESKESFMEMSIFWH